MTSPEFLSTPNLTPEQRVRENQRLSDIDKQMHMKAAEAFAEVTETKEAQKARLIFEIPDDAQTAKDAMTTELDPDYENAVIIHIDTIVSKPSRLPFLKKEVAVYEEQELAAWYIPAALDKVSMPCLGRDGFLYAIHQDEGYVVKKIVLDDLPLKDLIKLKAGIELQVRSSRSIKDFKDDL